jgi:hypothetical protein
MLWDLELFGAVLFTDRLWNWNLVGPLRFAQEPIISYKC